MDSILSVGIDIGTTTTHLTLSRLHLANSSMFNEPGRMVIEQREIVYQSPIHFTPLAADCRVDGDRVLQIVLSEYALAGVSASDIATGAIIITGETVKKRNASEVVHALSGLAGKFVVASAGPNLESILAARGSGAAQASKEKQLTICNVDIGGGTTNLAIFTNGDFVSSTCLAIGGRLVCLNQELCLTELTDSGNFIASHVLGRVLNVGESIERNVAQQLAHCAAKMIVDVCRYKSTSRLLPSLLVSEPLEFEGHIDEYWFSGGVAEVMRDESSISRDVGAYGDLGVLLGRALVGELDRHSIRYRVPDNPIRATVIGAGMHSMQLSGSTITLASQGLPINNLPIIRPFEHCEYQGVGNEKWFDPDLWRQRLDHALVSRDLNWSEQPVALFLPELGRMGYVELNRLSYVLVEVFRDFRGKGPFVIICTHDIAAALGQAIGKLMSDQEVIVLDGVSSCTGDYIDIGQPVANNRSVPVVLKDLVFGR